MTARVGRRLRTDDRIGRLRVLRTSLVSGCAQRRPRFEPRRRPRADRAASRRPFLAQRRPRFEPRRRVEHHVQAVVGERRSTKAKVRTPATPAPRRARGSAARPVGRQNLMRPTDTDDANLLAAACCRLAGSASAAAACVPPESRAPMTDAAASRCSAGRTDQAPASDAVR